MSGKSGLREGRAGDVRGELDILEPAEDREEGGRLALPVLREFRVLYL